MNYRASAEHQRMIAEEARATIASQAARDKTAKRLKEMDRRAIALRDAEDSFRERTTPSDSRTIDTRTDFSLYYNLPRVDIFPESLSGGGWRDDLDTLYWFFKTWRTRIRTKAICNLNWPKQKLIRYRNLQRRIEARISELKKRMHERDNPPKAGEQTELKL